MQVFSIQPGSTGERELTTCKLPLRNMGCYYVGEKRGNLQMSERERAGFHGTRERFHAKISKDEGRKKGEVPERPLPLRTFLQMGLGFGEMSPQLSQERCLCPQGPLMNFRT